MERTSMNPVPLWLKNSLLDESVTDICINGAESAFVDRGNGLEAVALDTALPWTEDEIRAWTLEQISQAGKTWDARHPFIDATLPSGHRLHVAFPPLCGRGILLSLRRLPFVGVGQSRETSYSQQRWASSPLYLTLRQAVQRGESILIAGATGSGKTTLATDLLEAVPHTERMIALEDTPELAPRHPHFLSLISRPPNADGFGEVQLRTLLKQALRMRPDRIILGECRGNEVLDLLQALNTGHGGALATLHANSPRDSLRRIELLCLLASGGAIPVSAIRELLAVGVQWIAQVQRTPSGRRITEVCRIEGREGDTILLRPIHCPTH